MKLMNFAVVLVAATLSVGGATAELTAVQEKVTLDWLRGQRGR